MELNLEQLYDDAFYVEKKRWGSNDNPKGVLFEGDVYYVERIEIHSWHTKLYLRGIRGGKFNSSCFEKVEKV